MKKALFGVIGTAAVGVVLAGIALSSGPPVLGDRVSPLKAKISKADLVTAYNPCINPTLTMGGYGIPACTSLRSGDNCRFGSKGKGKHLAKVYNNPVTLQPDIGVQAVMSGLDPQCEGLTLTATTSMVVTSSDCGLIPPNDGCTSVTLNDFAVGTCVVINGKCSFKGNINVLYPGLLVPGKNYEICFLGHNIWHYLGLKQSRIFWAGLRFP